MFKIKISVVACSLIYVVSLTATATSEKPGQITGATQQIADPAQKPPERQMPPRVNQKQKETCDVIERAVSLYAADDARLEIERNGIIRDEIIVRRTALRKSRDIQFLQALLPDRSFREWPMKVAAIDTATAYTRRQEEYIHLKLDVGCKFQTIFHARFLAIPHAVQLFRVIVPGDTVTVSGYVLGSSDPKSLEHSLTERGSIERPEYDVHLTNPQTVEIPSL